jgi:CO/xanthine dehydrogenase FAD-binding subunit
VTQSFITAETIDDAVAALAGGARPVAGGTDLVVGARQGKAPLPASIVAIHRVAELRVVVADGDTLRLGALTTHEEIAEHELVLERLTALADASAIVGSHATRVQGTIGGNVMNASPAMELGGPLMCLGAAVTLRSHAGERSVAVADLFAGPGRTIAEAGELLTEVTVPLPPARTGSCYARLEYRRQMEIAVVGATAVVAFVDDRIDAAKVAITALAPTIRLVPEAEAALVGSDGGRESAERAAQAAADASQPISDVRASDRYRRAMAAVLTRRAIEAAVARARGVAVPVPASRYLHAAA